MTNALFPCPLKGRTMRRVFPLVFASLLFVSACGDEQGTPSEDHTSAFSTSSASTTSSGSTKPSTPQETSEEPSSEEPAAQSPDPTASDTEPQEPYVVECLPGTPGPSRMSDGTTQPTDFCANQEGAEEYREAEANAGLPDPATIPYADGGTCPAAICGYGHDENGNPNPSSGEIQSWWMNCISTNSEEYCRANDPYTN